MNRAPCGVGIGLRHAHFESIFSTPRDVRWLEVIPENFMAHGGQTRRVLERARERWPLLAHGVCLSIGGPDAFDGEQMRSLREVLRLVNPPFFTEHLSYSSARGVHFHDLLPLPFSAAAVRHAAARLREVQCRLERPVALENISYYAEMPGSAMSEEEFVHAVLDEADALLLLDVNNVYVNAKNHGKNPSSALRALPLERARQIHLAGHCDEGDVLIDHHGAPVCDEVWSLYEEALRLTGPLPTLLEWDTNVPPLDRLLDEADKAQAILDRVCGGRA
jgi:uncharacterized protein (UPF0276 family)